MGILTFSYCYSCIKLAKMAQWEAKGKSFLITGGASGLGAAYAEAFLNEGAKKIAILDIAEEVGKAKAESLNKTYGDKVIFIKCDVSKEEDITRAFDEVVTQFKQLDVLINNAGIMVDAPTLWRTACEVNWEGLVSFSLKGIKHMRKDNGGAGGTIINISSTAGLTRFPLLPIYNGSKIAVLHFTQSISMPPFFERTGIRMLTMCPGPTDTPLMEGLEKRGYNPQIGQELADSVVQLNTVFQKVESMVTAFLYMFKNGAPASIWLSLKDRPVKDITSIVDKSFKALEEVAI